MAFVLRVTETPSLNVLLSLEQIVIVDKTGPAIPLGPSPGAVCLVGEFLKGPFVPTEVTSTAMFLSLYGGVSSLLSQSLLGIQDGSNIRYEGNGALQLVGKQFQRLVIQRVDTDMIADDTVALASQAKVFVKFTVNVHAQDQDPLDITKTGRDIVIPAGTRFADAPLGTATYVIALSQDIIIPKGTVINTASPPTGFVGRIAVDQTTLNNNGTAGATAFFVKNSTAAISTMDTSIDTALPNTQSVITSTSGELGIITSAGANTAAFAPGTTAIILSKKIDSLYAIAIGKTLPTDSPMEDITVIWAARRGEPNGATNSEVFIRSPLQDNAVASSLEGRGRIAIVSGPRVGGAPGDSATALAAVQLVTNKTTGTPTENGRVDRKIVTFPYVRSFSADLGKTVVVSPDGYMAATLSNFKEEVNPGAANAFIQSIQGYEEAFQNTPLARQDFINFKANGVAALRKDRAVGWWFQSGVTSVDPAVDQARAPIKRRRMADLIQDQLAAIGAKYNKKPATTENVDMLVGECTAFLLSLKSPQNPSLQRIEDFLIDEKSGNLPQLVAVGIFTIIIKVRLLASLDTIVFQTTIGETVEIEQAA